MEKKKKELFPDKKEEELEQVDSEDSPVDAEKQPNDEKEENVYIPYISSNRPEKSDSLDPRITSIDGSPCFKSQIKD